MFVFDEFVIMEEVLKFGYWFIDIILFEVVIMEYINCVGIF